MQKRKDAMDSLFFSSSFFFFSVQEGEVSKGRSLLLVSCQFEGEVSVACQCSGRGGLLTSNRARIT